MWTEVRRWTNPQRYAIRSAPHVGHVRRVLAIDQMNALFEHPIVKLVDPDRQPRLQAKAFKMRERTEVADAGDSLLPAKVVNLIVREQHLLGDVVQHHGAAMRGWQRRNERAVKA